MIYICTHKDFKEFATEGDYTIMTSTELSNKYNFPVIVADNDLKPLKLSYCEGYMIKQIYLNLNTTKYTEWIGINHYRRYFPNQQNEEVTLPIPYNTNMHRQYAGCHNINDLIKVENIINEYYPEYKTDYSNINVLFPCNIFIMQTNDFIKYYNFVFGVLHIFSKQNNLYTDEDVRQYVNNNRKQYTIHDFNLDYQSRLHGFLMERLSTIFFIKQFKEKQNTLKPIITV